MKDKEEYNEVMVDVALVWEQSVIDPLQYKPLAPLLKPIQAVVIVQVPERMLITESDTIELDPDYVYLTPEGLAYASREIAKAIHKTYLED